ncbi:MAG: hypothetical protein H6727_00065 [Myxococcales bacterium]|nr:hypothetical protein [Myxococcales bacterium]
MAMGILWILFGLAVILAPLFGQRSFVLPALGISVGWVILALGAFRLFVGMQMEKQHKKAEELRRLRREQERAAASLKEEK